MARRAAERDEREASSFLLATTHWMRRWRWGLEAECADVGVVGWKRHRLEVHGAHAVVGAEDGAEEAAAQVKFHSVSLDGEVLRLAGEIAEDDQNRSRGRDVLRLANHDEDVLIVAVDGEVFAGVNGRVAVMKLDQLAVPVEEGVGVCILQRCVGEREGRGCFGLGWGCGFAFGGWRWSVPGDDGCCGRGFR